MPVYPLKLGSLFAIQVVSLDETNPRSLATGHRGAHSQQWKTKAQLTERGFDGWNIKLSTNCRALGHGGQFRGDPGIHGRRVCEHGFLWSCGDQHSAGLTSDARPNRLDSKRLLALRVAASP